MTLVAKMERLRGKPVGSDVHSTLSVWEDAIRKVQALRQDEVRCRSRLTLEPAESRVHQEDKGNILMPYHCRYLLGKEAGWTIF